MYLQVCTRDELSASVDLKTACTALVDTHEDNLARAALDNKGAEWCSATIRGCDMEKQKEALASKHKTKSEKAPFRHLAEWKLP